MARLLLLETHHLGDAVLSVPFVRGALKKHEVMVICRPSQAEVYKAIGEANLRIETWEPPWMARESGLSSPRLGCFRRLAGSFRPEIAVSCWPDLRVHFLLRLSGAPRRVGFPMVSGNLMSMHLPWRRRRVLPAMKLDQWLRPWLLNEPLVREASGGHLDVWRKLSRSLELESVEATPWFVRPEPPSEISSWLEEKKRIGRQVWLLHTGARTPTKRWPIRSFLEVANRLISERNASVLLVGVDGPTATPAETQIWNPQSVSEFLSVVDKMAGLLCMDSFPAHAAAAMGKRVWTIFSSQEPERFAPFGNEARTIAVDVCPFRPCLDRCLMPSIVCLEGVTPEMVWQRIHAEG